MYMYMQATRPTCDLHVLLFTSARAAVHVHVVQRKRERKIPNTPSLTTGAIHPHVDMDNKKNYNIRYTL